VFWRLHHGGLSYDDTLDHSEHMASWNAHFSRMVVHAAPSVLEVLMCEQDFLSLREEQSGLAETQDDGSPLVGLQPKGQVVVLCNLGFPNKRCNLALRECLRTTCSGLLVTETSACVSGYALRVGFAMKRFARRTVHVRGIREEGGRRDTRIV
jgi:hypothetical protein